MPSQSQKQQKFFGAELGRKRAGKKTRTGMTKAQLEEFAATKRRGLPERVKPKAKAKPKKKGKR